MIITISIDDRTNQIITSEAAQMGCSRSSLIRNILQDYVNNNGYDITSYRKWLAFKAYMEKEAESDGE